MGKSCIFVPLTEEHLPAALGIYNHYAAETTCTFHDPLSQDEFRGLVFHEDKRYRSLAIIDEKSARLAGYCSLRPHGARQAYRFTAEVTVYLHPDYVGLGLGGPAIDRLGKEARAQGFHVLVAAISGENAGSIRLFEKKGYEKTGHLREVGYKFDRFLDVVYFQKILTSTKA